MKTESKKDWFKGGYQKFAAIPASERSDYNKSVIETKPSSQPVPHVFIKPFPSSSTFHYQEYKLRYSYRQQTENPSAILIHVHGLHSHGEASGYYCNVIADHNPQVNVYSFDQMNFGKSEGPFRGQVDSLEDSMNQVNTFVDFLLKKYQNKPKVYLSGNSYGGAIIFTMAVLKPQRYAGLVLIVPAIRNLAEKTPCLKKLGKCLGCLMPRTLFMDQSGEDDNKYNTSAAMQKDELYYKGQMVPGSIRTILNAMDEVSQLYDQLKTPYIIFEAGKDKVVDPFAALDLEKTSPSPDKTTIYCENMWHSVFLEQEIEGISEVSAEWLKVRI